MVSFTDFALDANECEVFALRAIPIKTISLSVLERKKNQSKQQQQEQQEQKRRRKIIKKPRRSESKENQSVLVYFLFHRPINTKTSSKCVCKRADKKSNPKRHESTHV